MSSREVLYNSTSEERDGPGAPSQSVRRTESRQMSHSLRLPTETNPQTALNLRRPSLSAALEIIGPLDLSLGEEDISLPLPEPPMATDVPLPDVPESGTSPGGSQAVGSRLKLNGERRQRAIRKHKPTDSDSRLRPSRDADGDNSQERRTGKEGEEEEEKKSSNGGRISPDGIVATQG